jgi:hypothetical protein
MKNFRPSDPAEGSALLRLVYRDWRPTRFGRWVNRFACWWSGLGLPPSFQAALEVRGRISGSIRSNPVVIATVNGKDYLVSMLGPDSDWVKNVEAAHGDAVIRQGRRRPVRLVAVPPEQRAPILASTSASPQAAGGTSRSPLARRCRISRPSWNVIPCTASTICPREPLESLPAVLCEAVACVL